MSAQGFKFRQAAADYHRGRPGWPEEAVDYAIERLGLAPESGVLDLAAGTGKLTQTLARKFERLIAVEPLDTLRAVLEEHVPEVDVRDGVAEAIPLDDASVDAIFVAEAFHWFDGAVALKEASRVLTERGGLVLLWNVPTAGWEPKPPDEARTLVRAAVQMGGEPGGARLERGEWKEAFESSVFAPLESAEFEHPFEVDRDGLIANTLSVSSLAGLDSQVREQLRADLTRLLPEGVYSQPLRTELVLTRRKD